jgi:ribulose-phosphate 3-epimerase
VRRLTNLPLDVHLMVDNPLDMIGPFADAGSDFLTVHVEVMDDVRRAFDAITARGVRPGVSLKPDTPVERILPLIADVDLALVMSVYPGYGGQKFIEDSYGRIRAIADTAAVANPDLILSVDGGVNFDNAPKLVSAGVNHLVAGTTVFRDQGARENVPKLREAALKGL